VRVLVRSLSGLAGGGRCLWIGLNQSNDAEKRLRTRHVKRSHTNSYNYFDEFLLLLPDLTTHFSVGLYEKGLLHSHAVGTVMLVQPDALPNKVLVAIVACRKTRLHWEQNRAVPTNCSCAWTETLLSHWSVRYATRGECVWVCGFTV
jgi:hypothetical protein